MSLKMIITIIAIYPIAVLLEIVTAPFTVYTRLVDAVKASVIRSKISRELNELVKNLPEDFPKINVKE